jgi:hypothetical protein
VFEVLEAAATVLIEEAVNPLAQIHWNGIYNFRLYRQICAPAHLPQFDAEHPPGDATQRGPGSPGH